MPQVERGDHGGLPGGHGELSGQVLLRPVTGFGDIFFEPGGGDPSSPVGEGFDQLVEAWEAGEGAAGVEVGLQGGRHWLSVGVHGRCSLGGGCTPRVLTTSAALLRLNWT